MLFRKFIVLFAFLIGPFLLFGQDSTAVNRSKNRYTWERVRLDYPNGKRKMVIKTKKYKPTHKFGRNGKTVIITVDYYESGKRKSCERRTRYHSTCWSDSYDVYWKKYSEDGKLIEEVRR